MLLDALFHCREGSAGLPLKNVMIDMSLTHGLHTILYMCKQFQIGALGSNFQNCLF
jgi:hypothetical protein